jgi:hypothetical protein
MLFRFCSKIAGRPPQSNPRKIVQPTETDLKDLYPAWKEKNKKFSAGKNQLEIVCQMETKFFIFIF